MKVVSEEKPMKINILNREFQPVIKIRAGKKKPLSKLKTLERKASLMGRLSPHAFAYLRPAPY